MKDENKALKQKIEEQEQKIFRLQLEQVRSPSHNKRSVTSSNPTLERIPELSKRTKQPLKSAGKPHKSIK